MRLPSYKQLSEEQDAILDLSLDGKHLVIGPPGTGKTVLALHRGTYLSKAKKPFKVLMYNHALHQYTSQAAKSLELQGSTEVYHSFFYKFIVSNFYQRLKEAGVKNEQGRIQVPQKKAFMPDFDFLLTRILRKGDETKFGMPHMIVDEGQDLPNGFYLFFSRMAKNAIVFADENQIITEDSSSISAIQAMGGFPKPRCLKKNYRNSKEIAVLAAGFYTGLKSGVPEIPERLGEKPQLIRTTSLQGIIERIIIAEKNASDKSIGILLQTKLSIAKFKVELEKIGTRNPVQTHKDDDVDFDSPGIKLVTHASSKGLEFDTVFLPELHELRYNKNNLDEVKRMLFVLVSRARERLILAYRGDFLPVLEAFPENWKDLLEEKEIRRQTGNQRDPLPEPEPPTDGEIGGRPSLPFLGVRVEEILPEIDPSGSWKKENGKGNAAGLEVHSHPEVHQLVSFLVDLQNSNPGKIIGVCTEQVAIYKRLFNRLPGKIADLKFHESSSSKLDRNGLGPGIHIIIGCELSEMPFDILVIPRAEQYSVNSDHVRKQLVGLLTKATERVLLSFEFLPKPLLYGVNSSILRRFQEKK